jgi:hypothetical protein
MDRQKSLIKVTAAALQEEIFQAEANSAVDLH